MTATVPSDIDGPAGEALRILERCKRGVDAVHDVHVLTTTEAQIIAARLAALQQERDALALTVSVEQQKIEYRDKLIARLEADRDGWMNIVGDIAALVPIPQIIKVTGTTGELIAWLKERVAIAAAQEDQIERLKREQAVSWRPALEIKELKQQLDMLQGDFNDCNSERARWKDRAASLQRRVEELTDERDRLLLSRAEWKAAYKAALTHPEQGGTPS